MDDPDSADAARKRRAELVIAVQKGADVDREAARVLMQPEAEAARTIAAFANKQHDVNALLDELIDRGGAVVRGDMAQAERMLVAQAQTLDQLFGWLARRAHLNVEEYPDAAEKYLRLAFKAQGHCRSTLETLGALKNPPVVYARQANIAHGLQQVNNGTTTRAGETETPPSELSGATHELLPDARASQAARRVDSPVEAVGTIHRAEKRRRKGP